MVKITLSSHTLTRLSELGAMVSVIQEPNLDPDARIVMGLLIPVSFPQPEMQNREGDTENEKSFSTSELNLSSPLTTHS